MYMHVVKEAYLMQFYISFDCFDPGAKESSSHISYDVNTVT